MQIQRRPRTVAVADPGFPVGGADPLGGGGSDLRRWSFSAKMYAKTKELGTVGGDPLDPPMSRRPQSNHKGSQFAKQACPIVKVIEIGQSIVEVACIVIGGFLLDA